MAHPQPRPGPVLACALACVMLVAIVAPSRAASPPKRKVDPEAAFHRWLEEHGGARRHQIGSAGSMGRGLFARVPIKSHEPAVHVPLKLCMSVFSAKQQPYARAFQDEDVELDDDSILALHILVEASNPKSFWAPYIGILPKQLDMPLVWSEKDLQELQGSPLKSYTEAALKQLRANFDRFQPSLVEEYEQWFPESLVTFDAYKWAMAIIYNRAWEMRIGERPAARVLAPLVDLANWAPDVPTAVVFDEKAGAVVMRTGKDYDEGQQIFVGYNLPASNWRLLQAYGFLVDDPARNEVVLDLQLSPSIPYYEEKEDLIAARRGSQGMSFVLKKDDLLPADLLYAMRISALTAEDWRGRSEAEEDRPVSYNSEVAAYETLASAVQDVIHRYRTTVSEDELLLHAGISRHTRLAVRLRIEEKIILRSAHHLYTSRKARIKERGPGRYREES
eukprot:tig00000455_g1005.t1